MNSSKGAGERTGDWRKIVLVVVVLQERDSIVLRTYRPDLQCGI